MSTEVVKTNGQEEASGLVKLALEKGHSVEVLERLVALQERVTDRDARMAYVSALSAFRAECPPIKKTRENTQFQTTRGGVKKPVKYAPLEEIDRVARPVAEAHGLIWTWDTRVEGDLMHVTCKVLHVDGHSESATVSLPFDSKAGASPQQKYAIAQTYGMRYSLIAALGITTADEDTDGGGTGELVDEEDLANLEALISEVGADEVKFCEWLGVAHLPAITKRDLPRAVQALEKKRK